MQVLMIGSVWPEPASSGAGLRMIELIRLFRRQGWAVTFASSAAPSDHMADLDACSVRRAAIAVNQDSFDHFVSELQPDLVLFDRFTMEEQFGWRVERCCPDALRVIETIDLHCLREVRRRLFRRRAAVVRDVARDDLYNDVALREIAALHRSDLSILVSDYEQQLLVAQFGLPASQLHLCPFMFENDAKQAQPGYQARVDFTTIGNFRHAPNRDAVDWLRQQIWPRIRAHLPQARLHVYGAYMPAHAAAMHDPEGGFLMHGRADSVDAVMRRYRLCLAPLRFGAGIKTKLADAMRNGAPVVSTSVGAEGMYRDDLAWPGGIEDDADAFADAAVRLYCEQARWQRAQADGHAIVRALFDAERNGSALIERLLSLRAELAAHRRRHFTGMMLRHHQQRSTEFMSRWIEAKNRQL